MRPVVVRFVAFDSRYDLLFRDSEMAAHRDGRRHVADVVIPDQMRPDFRRAFPYRQVVSLFGCRHPRRRVGNRLQSFSFPDHLREVFAFAGIERRSSVRL